MIPATRPRSRRAHSTQRRQLHGSSLIPGNHRGRRRGPVVPGHPARAEQGSVPGRLPAAADRAVRRARGRHAARRPARGGGAERQGRGDGAQGRGALPRRPAQARGGRAAHQGADRERQVPVHRGRPRRARADGHQRADQEVQGALHLDEPVRRDQRQARHQPHHLPRGAQPDHHLPGAGQVGGREPGQEVVDHLRGLRVGQAVQPGAAGRAQEVGRHPARRHALPARVGRVLRAPAQDPGREAGRPDERGPGRRQHRAPQAGDQLRDEEGHEDRPAAPLDLLSEGGRRRSSTRTSTARSTGTGSCRTPSPPPRSSSTRR